jgi:hypothetical protein
VTPEGERELIDVLEGIAISLERIADHFDPDEEVVVRRPAVLGTATYTREERERQELREKLRGNAPTVGG